MSQKFIGVFDSGLGGLTCVKELMEIMPDEPIVYFGEVSPSRLYHLQILIFYPIPQVVFLFVYGFLCCAKACKFD